MSYLSYQNPMTLDFVSWASRHENMRNKIASAYAVCRDFPEIPQSVQCFRTGSRDLRQAVMKYFPATPGDYDSFELRRKVAEKMVYAWRMYQNYLRSRDDIAAAGKQNAIREQVRKFEAACHARDRGEPIAQESGNA
jgi:hypothetical protein